MRELGGPESGPDGEIDCDRDFDDPAASAYVLPFPVGRTYNLFQGYCSPNPNWGHYNWFAYDLDLATGDTVVASRGGWVTFAPEDRPNVGGRCGVSGENLIVVLHEDGTVMHYVHLTTGGALVAVGDRVAQGQPIGLSGNSGCSSGPHLHVVVFLDRTDGSRQASLPVNYRNAVGPLDENRGLVQGRDYTAGPHRSGGLTRNSAGWFTGGVPVLLPDLPSHGARNFSQRRP